MVHTVMTRTPRSELAPPWDAAWDALNGLSGEPAFVEVLASAPELLEFVMAEFYQKIFFNGRVDERYKQLLRIRLSLAHGCRSCNLQNSAGMATVGYDARHIAAIEGDRSIFDDAERAVLDFADQLVLTNTGGRLDAALHTRLRAHFDEAQICELAVVAGVIGGMAKMAFVLDVVEKEANCPFIARTVAA